MKHSVFVCTTCGTKEDKPSHGRGTIILQKLQDALANDTYIEIKPIGCLSNCSRGASVALSADGKFGWVFGEQSESADDIAALAHAARQYVVCEDGFLAKIDRPKPVMARVPYFDYQNE